MMRAGKDYITKDIPEFEDARSAHLRELVSNVAAQGKPIEPAEEPADKPAVDQPAQSGQAKPTLKLR